MLMKKSDASLIVKGGETKKTNRYEINTFAKYHRWYTE